MSIWQMLATAFVLTIAVSLDTAAAGFAYGANKTRVHLLNVTVISLICSIMLAISLSIGSFINQFIPESITAATGFLILVHLGAFKIIQYIRNRKKTIEDSPPEKITFAETVALAVALSVDGIAVGIGTAIGNINIIFALFIVSFSLLTNVAFFMFGQKLGKGISRKTTFNLSWLSGLILIIIAILKIIS